MRAAFLEPDVQLARVTVTTTVSEPTPYEATVAVDEAQPDAEPENAAAPTADTTEAEAEMPATADDTTDTDAP
ncbi:hypothetical protein FHW23_000190 [Curtobacterium pusillum]|uniref:Uncharacterized protein n=1 Tax=Curtobacterium pusillum TaxID=69373 RepID=A0AAW3T326_9MICO|nr:hypothetical protein [Curtobacterium pusillum]MBA8988958.1 hypothetical protein [Curtobacterium pusillum]